MRYYLDTEFNEFDGDIISLALVSDAGRELYVATACEKPGEWVKKNVMPIVTCKDADPMMLAPQYFGVAIQLFLQDDPSPVVVADWPDDISYFCKAMITGPGQMIAIPKVTFELQRVDSYPSQLPNAIQHNALWDARALKHRLTKHIAWARLDDLRRGICV